MANSLVTCSIIAKEALAVLENSLGFAANVNRDYESEFRSNQARGYSPGQTINIKRPPRYTYRAGRVSVPQSTTETTIPLTLTQGGTDMSFTSVERTLSLQQMQQKIQAAMATVANEVDRQGLDLARTSVYNAVGTVGTQPSTQATALALITAAGQRLNEMGAPVGQNMSERRSFIANPAMNGALVQGLAGLFNAQAPLEKQYKNGVMVPSLGFNFVMDQNVVNHVNGTQPTGPTANAVNGAGQTGATIAVNGAAITGTITRGSVIVFAGVNAVNPQSRQSTGAPMQFVVTADVAASATSIPISPAIVTSGPFQNVDASPANNASLTVLGAASATYAANIAYDRDAFTLATVPLYAPPGGKGVIDVAQESYKGINLRVIETYDAINDNHLMRFDILFGWAATYPELAVKAVA